jgi:hypothetical protein
MIGHQATANVGLVDERTLRSIVGTIDDDKVIEILELQPSVSEVEQAIVWAGGNGGVLSKGGRPLTGKAAAIVDILTAGEEVDPLRGG